MLSRARERELASQGYRLVAGIDEVGRGALAGPVVAAAVILPQKINGSWLKKVRDSKQLDPARRELLFPFIRGVAISVGIGTIPHDEIDSRGIVTATRMAMKQAVEQLTPSAEWLLIDFMRLPDVRIPQDGIVDGDSLCFSIACASIVAKVHRDHLLIELDRVYPGYGFAQHKGYGTPEHLSCLRRLGPSPIHRRTFRPLNELFFWHGRADK